LCEIQFDIVEPEYSSEAVWRIPRLLTRDEIQSRLQSLPCVFGGVGLGSRMKLLQEAARERYFKFEALEYRGSQLRDDHQLKFDPAKAKKGEQLIGSLVATLQRMSDLAASQTEPAKWKWDVENLKKLQLLVARLEEAGVAEVLDEEG